jgi:hypothetical protein
MPSKEMSENPNQEAKEKKEGPIDLSVLAELSFGPKWGSDTSKKSTPAHHKQFSQPGEGKRKEGHHFKKDRRPKFDKSFSKKPAAPFKPIVDVAFYPDDEPFKILTKAIRTSCKTYELFEIAKLILEKPERFVAVLTPKQASRESSQSEKQKFFVSAIDNVPFLTEEEAINYTLKNHIDKFFNTEDVEVEPPKGNFIVVNKCGFTGELLGPPNYHRYQELLKEHYNNNLSNIPYEKFIAKVESVKDEESINAWVAKMTKSKRYTQKDAPEGQEPKVYNTWEEARAHLLAAQKNDLVRPKESVRVSGKLLESMPKGDIKRSVEAELRHQREFPLDTANNLRGRLRRMNFAIYKKGAKGVSYVCVVKRKFRNDATRFSDSFQKLIEFIEKNPKVNVTDLPHRYLGLPKPQVASAKQEVSDSAAEDKDATPAEAVPEAKAPELSNEQQAHIRQLMLDLRWLVSEGYVTEYADGSLYAQPPLPKPKKAAEEEASPEGVEKETKETESSSEEKPQAEAVAEPEQKEEQPSEEKEAKPKAKKKTATKKTAAKKKTTVKKVAKKAEEKSEKEPEPVKAEK